MEYTYGQDLQMLGSNFNLYRNQVLEIRDQISTFDHHAHFFFDFIFNRKDMNIKGQLLLFEHLQVCLGNLTSEGDM